MEEIDLSENEFTFLPKIITLSSLRKINLISNKIGSYEIMEDENNPYHYETSDRYDLEFLYLNKNLLDKLPVDFIKNFNFHKIKHMALDENPIKEYTKEIKNIISTRNFENVITFNTDNIEEAKEEEFEESEKDQKELKEAESDNKSKKFSKKIF